MTMMQDTVTVMMNAPVGAAADPLMLPRRIGTVKLGDQIGQGGSGIVFAAFDEALNRRVAVKILHNLRGSARDVERGRFVDGVRNSARVQHANLVGVHNVDVVGDVPLIVMEFVDGRSVRDVLTVKKAFDLPTALYFAREICRGVEALHVEQIVHRDLKPANVLIDRHGQPRVCDFGLACELDSAQFGTASAAIAGSPYYMAPEVFDGVISPQGDVYALGVMLFEMLVGRQPFGGDTIDAVREAHQENEAPLDALAKLNLPEELSDTIGRSMHKQRIMRYKTAGHFLRALEPFQTNVREDMIRSRIADTVDSLRISGRSEDVDRTPTPTPANTYDIISQRAAAKRKLKPDEPA